MSLKLFDIEILYQNLKNKLGTTASDKYKLLSIQNFISKIIIDAEQTKYYSYYLDLQPIFFEIIKKENFNFISPDDFGKLLEINLNLAHLQIFKDNRAEFENINFILDKARENSLNICCEEKEDESISKLDVNGLSLDYLPVVLIENINNQPDPDSIEVGVIYNLHLNSTVRSKIENLDNIEFKNLININEAEILEQLNHAAKNAKRECEKNKIKTHSYNFTFYFDEFEHIYSGSSLGISAMCLAYNAILISELNTNYYKFRSDTVFTSEVDKNGNLLKIDRKNLEIKLKTIFFSPYKKFVIPEDNLIEAKEILSKLLEKYPARWLELIPIRNHEQVFKNLDIVERCELKFVQKVGVKLKRNERKITIGAAAITILIVAWFFITYLIPHLDKNPTYGKFEDEKFKAFNKHDIKIWESETVEGVNNFIFNDKENFNCRFIISDIDNDGMNEILYFYMSRLNSDINRTLFCISPKQKSKWFYKLNKNNCSFIDNEFDDNNFEGKSVYVFNFKNNGTKNIIYTVNSERSSSFGILKLNSQGELLSEFWNDGFLTEVKSADIEKDGEQELVAGYCNNRFNKAALVIFDPDYIIGQSPHANLRKDSLMGKEKYYILFPRTIMNYYCGRDINTVEEIWKLKNGGLSVYVTEGSSNEKNPYSFVIYKFDTNMKLLDISLSSTFVGNYETLVATNVMKPIGDLSLYANSLKDSVLFWDGDEFVNKPAINKWYLVEKDTLEKLK